jgi:hypothetical protein
MSLPPSVRLPWLGYVDCLHQNGADFKVQT